MKRFILLALVLLLLLTVCPVSAFAANVGTYVPEQKVESIISLQKASPKYISNSVSADAVRHIKWTIASGWASSPGIALYVDGTEIQDISYIIAGTTGYVIPAGSHIITMEVSGTLILASCSV
jgi:hypothetical protein